MEQGSLLLDGCSLRSLLGGTKVPAFPLVLSQVLLGSFLQAVKAAELMSEFVEDAAQSGGGQDTGT